MITKRKIKPLTCFLLCLLLVVASGAFALFSAPDNVKAASYEYSEMFTYSFPAAPSPMSKMGRIETPSILNSYLDKPYTLGIVSYEVIVYENTRSCVCVVRNNKEFYITYWSLTEGIPHVLQVEIFYRIVLPDYSVTFDLDGGTRTGGGTLAQTVGYGQNAVAPTVKREGYIFRGWDNSFIDVTEDKTITALWEQLPDEPVDPGEDPKPGQSFNVIFDDPYIVSGNVLQTVSAGFFTTPPVVERDGYNFVGWSVNGEVVDLAAYPVTSSVVFIAVWEKASDIEEPGPFTFKDIFFWNWNEDTPAPAKTVGWIINGAVVLCLLFLIFKRR